MKRPSQIQQNNPLDKKHEYRVYALKTVAASYDPNTHIYTYVDHDKLIRFTESEEAHSGEDIASCARQVCHLEPYLITVRAYRSRKETILWVNWTEEYQRHAISKYTELRKAGKLALSGTF